MDKENLDQTQPDGDLQLVKVEIEGLSLGAESSSQLTSDLGDPIGTVETLSGVVTVTRADGTSVDLNVGDKLYQGDSIQTSDDGGLGAVFADTSTFAVGENSEIVLDELIYDPGEQEGSTVISVVEGTIDYVSGQIAKINPDAVAITTPVATIGIRGTKVFVEYVNGEFKALNLLEPTLNGEAAGEIVLYDLNGNPLGTINEPATGWEYVSGVGDGPKLIKLSQQAVDQLTDRLESLLPTNVIEKARDAMEMKKALEETAEMAEEEARLAEEALKEAEAQAKGDAEAAEAAQAELELLQKHLTDLEAQLDAAQEELTDLLALNEVPVPPIVLDLQGQVEALQTAYQQVLADMQDALSRFNELNDIASRSWQFFELQQESYDTAYNGYNEARIALREVSEQSNAFMVQVAEDDGYPANVANGDDGFDNLSIAQLANLSTAAGGNSDHLVDGQQGDPNDQDGATFRPHETGDGDGGEDDDLVSYFQNNPTTGTGNQQDDQANGSGDTRNDSPVLSDGPSVQLVTIDGRAIDGYVKLATVFVDENNNGILDAGEESTTSDDLGYFSLETDAPAGSTIVIRGGIDIATGDPFYGTLKVTLGSDTAGPIYVTPLTTLVSTLTEKLSAETTAQAQNWVEQTFGITGGLDELATIDPISGALNGIVSPIVTGLGVQVQNLILQAGTFLQTASQGSVTQAQATDALYEAIAGKIEEYIQALGEGATAQSLNVSVANDIVGIINTAATELGLTIDPAVMSEAGDLISSLNAYITSYVQNENLSVLDQLSNFARVGVVANDAAAELTKLVNGEVSNTDAFVNDLATKIANADIGDVTGDGQSDNGTFNDGVHVINGEAVDGYVKGATVFVDEDGDLQLDAGFEESSTTDAYGSYQFNTDAPDGSMVVVYGGTDIATNKPFYGILTAPAGTTGANESAIATPLTTLMTAVMKANSSLSAEEAQNQIETAFGFGGDTVSLTQLDPIAGANDAPTAKIAALGVQIQNLIVQAGTFLETASDGSVNSNQTSAALYDAIAAQLSDFNVDESADVKSVVEAAANALSIDLSSDEEQLLQDAAEVVAEGNALISSYVESGQVGTQLLENVSRVAVVAHDVAEELSSDTPNVSGFSGNIADKASVAEIGDVEGDGFSNQPISLNGVEDEVLIITKEQLLSGVDEGIRADVSISNVTVASGSLIENEDETWSYTPEEDANGDVSISYTLSDGESEVAANGVISLKAVNDGPDAKDDQITLTVGQNTFSVAQLLGNDVDVEGDDLTITGFTFDDSQIENIVIENEQVIVTTQEGYEGDISFDYDVTDGADTAAATASVQFSGLSGLVGRFYTYNRALDNKARGEIVEQMYKIIDGIETPDAVFVASDLSFNLGYTTLNTAEELESFIDGSGEIIQTNSASEPEGAGLIHLEGGIALDAGTYRIKVHADDGYSIKVDGEVVAEVDAHQSPTTTEHASFKVEEGGLHSIEIIYWDQGGAFVFDAQIQEITEDSVTPYQAIGGGMLQQTYHMADDTSLDLSGGLPVDFYFNDIDMGEGGAGSSLKLGAETAAQIAGGDGYMVIDGGQGDTVELVGNGGWTQSDSAPEGYTVYQNSEENVEVHVANGVSVAS